MSHPSSDEFEGEEETATSAIASPDNSLSQISLNPNNPNNNDSGIENGNSSNIVSTSEDNGDDDNSDFERDSTRRGHNIVTMRVAAPPTSAFYEGGGAGSQMVDVDLTPPDKLLKMATDRAAKLASKKRVEEAMAEQVKVLALTRIVFGDSHWRVPEAYVSLARAYLELRGLAEQARLHCETARALISQIAQQQSPSQRDNTLLVKLNMFLVMGRSLTKLKRFEEAESALNKADRCSRERNSSSVIDPSAMLRTDNTIATALGRLYFCQKKSQQALTCFEQVAEMTSKIYGDDADELISVYTDMGKAEQMGAGGGGGVGAEETSSSHSHEKAIEHFLHAHSIASA
ncbi:tetratricopeptide repeat protein 23-like, partial [Symsagittifera roscoffensis]|uniref:tetratricopeptide repeat protein 23-like n=1 Tax=Symsagittifera roscoffensis TaxID=84072 RepID=UPI00307CA4DF